MTKRLQLNSEPRIPAQHSTLGAALVYHGLIRPATKRMFRSVWLDQSWTATVAAFNWDSSAPVLCYATHPSWWDGYLAAELFRNVFPRTGFLMMEEAQLRRYFFFRWQGCFSVDRDDPREGLRAIRYAAHLLRSTVKPLVWIFPQGEIQPGDRRPLVLYSGAAEIAIRAAGVWCVPVALRYEFGGEQHPEALIKLGYPRWVAGSEKRLALQTVFEDELTRTADALRDMWNTGNLAPMQSILTGKVSTNRIFDQLLGWFVQRYSDLRR